MDNYNPFALVGKRILVTGASAGIGRAIAVACSRMGAVMVVTGRNQVRLDETYHLLDGVVHCAGIGFRKPCKMLAFSDVDEVMSVNFKSSVCLQAALLKEKKVNKRSSIVFLASRAAVSPSIGNSLYSASKGALISYANCLALELAPRLVRVNCISPAMVWTDLILQGGLTKEDLEREQLKYPLKRYGTPEDVAHLAVYLLSDASSWMTGSCIDLTGGGE